MRAPASASVVPRSWACRRGTAASSYAAILDLVHRRGCRTVFVEGGGATVSGFLAAGLLDRLQVTVAPALLGDGLPGLRLPEVQRLADAAPLACRVLRMGDDVLFDCDPRAV